MLSQREEASRRSRAEVRGYCDWAMQTYAPLGATDRITGVDLCTDAVSYGGESSVISITQTQALEYPLGLSSETTMALNHPPRPGR